MINLKSFNFTFIFLIQTSQLYGHPNDVDGAILNVDFAAQYWIQNGCPRSKMVLGVPAYGRSFAVTGGNFNIGGGGTGIKLN